MKRFIRYCVLLSIPLIVMVPFYIMEDPYKVIWHYDNYYPSDNVIELNRGYVSIMHYINHHKELGYDSFIFGNSRSIAFHEKEWKKYIPKSNRCYHFDVSGGSIRELYGEINYINKNGILRNALLVFDVGMLGTTENRGILYSMPPILKNGKDLISFHNEYFWSFYKFGFFLAYIDYKTHKDFKPYMIDYFIDPSWKRGYDSINNELNWDKHEASISEGTYYSTERIKRFENAQFPGKVSDCVLNDERKELLREIKNIFYKQNTDYRIIISPIYDQIKINPEDLLFLYDVFGQENVFDFSGISKWSLDYQNYYETSHYRSCVANEILKIVYADTIKDNP